MAEFSPNLDDGELWLPSEIIADVGLHPDHHHHNYRRLSFFATGARRSHQDVFSDEDLASQLAAVGLIDRAQLLAAVTQPLALPPHPHGFRTYEPVFGFEPLEMRAWTGLGLPATRAAPDVHGGGFGACSRPVVLRPWPMDPVQPQLLRSGPTRPPWSVQNRFGLVRPAGPRRECGGTGVFLPRVISSHEAKKKHQRRRRRRAAAAANKKPSNLWTSS